MADKKISELTAYTNPIATDELPIVDVTGGITKKITKADLTAKALDDITDVTIATPTTDQVLRYNGSEWVNGNAVNSSASPGIEFFPDDTTIVASGTQSSYPIKTLSKIPVTTAEDVDTISCNNNTVLYGTYLYNTALERTSIDAGIWSFNIYAAVSSAVNTTSLRQNINRVRPGTGTVTTTSTGTTRTCIASSGTPFAAADIDVGGTVDSDSYLMTTTGYFRILSRVSDTEITIKVPSTYTNQTTVAYSVHKRLFQITTPELNNTAVTPLWAGLQLYTVQTVQGAFTVQTTDKLANAFFGVSTGTRDIYFSHNGTTRYSHFSTPLITLHNNLSGLQGGTANEMYHLTSAQHTVINTPSTAGNLMTSNGTDWTSGSPLPVKATGAEVDTGTDDAKFVTSKAMEDSSYAKTTAIPVKATAAENAAGTDDAKFLTPLSNVGAFNYSMARQAIINGNFDVWQRGTTFTFTTTDGSFTADRYLNGLNADGGTLPTIVMSRQAQTPGGLYSSYYFMRVAPNGAGSSLGNNAVTEFSQKIENGTRNLCGDGKKVTLSFYARSSIANKSIGIRLLQNYGSGGSPTSQEIIAGTVFVLTSSWVKYTHTFTTNTLASKTFGTAGDDHLRPFFSYYWGSTRNADFGGTGTTALANGTIDIAQVQLCAGDVALPFMPKSYEEELRACQRYCQKIGGTDIFNMYSSGSAVSTTSVQTYLKFNTTMRTIPTLTTSGTATDYLLRGGADTIVCSAEPTIAVNGTTIDGANLNCIAASGLTAGHAYLLRNNNTANGYLLLSAEL